MDKYPPSWKLPDDWAEGLAIKLAIVCDIWSSNGPQVRPSGRSTSTRGKTCHIFGSPPPLTSIPI